MEQRFIKSITRASMVVGLAVAAYMPIRWSLPYFAFGETNDATRAALVAKCRLVKGCVRTGTDLWFDPEVGGAVYGVYGTFKYGSDTSGFSSFAHTLLNDRIGDLHEPARTMLRHAGKVRVTYE